MNIGINYDKKLSLNGVAINAKAKIRKLVNKKMSRIEKH
jgi:hypothetical protein